MNTALPTKSSSAHARYRELLYAHGHGYPLWLPEPNAALPASQKVEGTCIGDVDILTDDGGFEYLWNVHRAANHPFNKARVPPGFVPLPPLDYTDPLDVRIVEHFHPEKTAITSSSVKKRALKLDASFDPASGIVPASGGVEFEFNSENNAGAISLVTSRDAADFENWAERSLARTRSESEVAAGHEPTGLSSLFHAARLASTQYAATNALGWYQHVTQTLQRDLEGASLYLVTGTDKCSSWGVASFARPSSTSGGSLKFVAAGAATASASSNSSWTADFGVEHRVLERPLTEYSQCIFARGYVISVRQSMFSKLSGGHAKAKSKYHGGSRSIEAPDPVTTEKSPAALLGESLLEQNPNTSVALVHDEDWIAPVLRGEVNQTRGIGASSFLDLLIGCIVSSWALCSNVMSALAVPAPAANVSGQHVSLPLRPSPAPVPVSGSLLPQLKPPVVSNVTSGTCTPAVAVPAANVSGQHVSLPSRPSPTVPASVPVSGHLLPQLKPPVVSTPAAKPRFFALVVGIDNYKDPGVSNLRGAVADANAIASFLTDTLGVEPARIRNLRNEEATRAAIVQAFRDLQNNPNIERDDPILVFYAGHGAQADPPPSWEAGGAGRQVQMIVPWDFRASTSEKEEEQGLLDITLGALLGRLSTLKGDNITVMFDCCHSGSGTRDGLDTLDPLGVGNFPRGILLPHDYAILPTVDQDILGGEAGRKAKVAEGFEHTGSASHVLLAACSEAEVAYETGGRGRFTQAVLQLLSDPATISTLTYQALLQQLPDLPSQHPQCEGKNSSRAIFKGKAPGSPRRVLYSVTLAGPKGPVTVKAGQVHGVVSGAEFDVFASQRTDAPRLFRVHIDTARAFTADASIIESYVPAGNPLPDAAWALQTKIGAGAQGDLAVSFSHDIPEFEAVFAHAVDPSWDIGGLKRVIRFVPLGDPQCELEVRKEGDHAVFVLVGDKVCTGAGLTRLPRSVPLSNAADIYTVLDAAANFFYHLRRVHPGVGKTNKTPLAGQVAVQAFQLEQYFDDETSSFSHRFQSGSSNLIRAGMLQLQIDREADEDQYGFKIISNVDYPLYAWVFMFDMSDLSISNLYKPNIAKSGADASIVGKGSLVLGFGAGGSQPQTFFLPEGLDVDVSYVKIFLASEPLDLADIAQPSPFDVLDGSQRASKPAKVQARDVWDTVIVPIVLKLQA